MNVMEAMQARRSVRKYLTRKVEAEKLQAVLESVRLTPSRHNDQNIRVIAVQDEAVKSSFGSRVRPSPWWRRRAPFWCSAPPARWTL